MRPELQRTRFLGSKKSGVWMHRPTHACVHACMRKRPCISKQPLVSTPGPTTTAAAALPTASLTSSSRVNSQLRRWLDVAKSMEGTRSSDSKLQRVAFCFGWGIRAAGPRSTGARQPGRAEGAPQRLGLLPPAASVGWSEGAAMGGVRCVSVGESRRLPGRAGSPFLGRARVLERCRRACGVLEGAATRCCYCHRPSTCKREVLAQTNGREISRRP